MRDGIVPVMDVNGNNGIGGFGGDYGAWWIIIIIILFGWGRGGYGFGGNGDGVQNNYVLASDFATIQRQLSDGFGGVEKGLDTIRNGVCDGFYTNAQLLNGVNTNILTTGNNITSQIADVGFGIKDCCCQQLRAIDSVNFNNSNNTSAIINAITENTRSLHDEIIKNRMEDKNAQIQAQQNEINALRLAASQEKQNAYLVDKLNPNKCPIPAYLTCNPNAPLNYSISYGNNGCGCGY